MCEEWYIRRGYSRRNQVNQQCLTPWQQSAHVCDNEVMPFTCLTPGISMRGTSSILAEKARRFPMAGSRRWSAHSSGNSCKECV